MIQAQAILPAEVIMSLIVSPQTLIPLIRSTAIHLKPPSTPQKAGGQMKTVIQRYSQFSFCKRKHLYLNKDVQPSAWHATGETKDSSSVILLRDNNWLSLSCSPALFTDGHKQHAGERKKAPKQLRKRCNPVPSSPNVTVRCAISFNDFLA